MVGEQLQRAAMQARFNTFFDRGQARDVVKAFGRRGDVSQDGSHRPRWKAVGGPPWARLRQLGTPGLGLGGGGNKRAVRCVLDARAKIRVNIRPPRLSAKDAITGLCVGAGIGAFKVGVIGPTRADLMARAQREDVGRRENQAVFAPGGPSSG